MSDTKETPMIDWNIHFKLVYIQGQLRAGKGLKNNFGKYSYRSNESIIQSIKPLLEETQTVLIQSDEIVCIEGRFYVKATSSIHDGSGDSIKSVGYARESANKKGMDDAQVTGACSSYSRKYSLNGLFAIDDNKEDIDSKDNAKIQKEEEQAMMEALKKKNFDTKVQFTIDQFIITTDKFKTMKQWDSAIEKIEKNRIAKNAVSLDSRFYNMVLDRYKIVMENGAEAEE